MYIYPDSEVLCTQSYFKSEDVLDKGSSSFKPANELAILQSIVISDIKKTLIANLCKNQDHYCLWFHKKSPD